MDPLQNLLRISDDNNLIFITLGYSEETLLILCSGRERETSFLDLWCFLCSLEARDLRSLKGK